jgi:hypothetical protein
LALRLCPAFVAESDAAYLTIAKLDHPIERLARQHPEASLFADLPRAGGTLQPPLMVAFGTQRDRYSSASEVQAYSGIAPVTESSGQSR